MPPSESKLRERVEARVSAWLLGAGELGDRVGGKFEPAFAWVVTCSPPTASAEQLAVATMDLLLWFLFLDDYEGSDDAEFFARCAEAITQSGRPVDDGSVQARALCLFVEQRDRVAAHGRPMQRYIDERVGALQAYTRRNADRRAGRIPSVEAFLRLRGSTILFRAWFTLWEILAGFQLDDADYGCASFDRAIEAEIRWQVQQNELHSLTRDLADGTPNLIVLLEREQGMSRAAAIVELERSCESLVEELREARRELAAEGRDEGGLAAALDFLEHNIAGGRALYARALERYANAGS